MKTDEQLASDVADELRWTFGDCASQVEVSVRAGVVVISGVVADAAAKRAGGEAVGRVTGVRAIRNALAIPSYEHRMSMADESSTASAAGGA